MTFELAGNVSAASFAVALEDFGAVYKVEPIGDSQALPTMYITV